MPLARRTLLAVLLAAGCAVPALAQQPTGRLRGTISSVTADKLTVASVGFGTETVALAPSTAITWVVPAKLSEIGKGSFIGTAAVPGPHGALMALEVHVFPNAMRGVGEGHRPFDLKPDSTMTNGTVGSVTGAAGRTLTVTYNGGKQAVIVPPDTPIVGFAPATRAALRVGAHVIVFGPKAAGGSIAAARVLVGKNGLVPPM